jgi:hypothetical protein
MVRRGHVIGGGAYVKRGESERHHVLAIVDLDADTPSPELISIGFLGHGVSIDPRDPSKAAVFEKKGPGACYVDLKQRRQIAPITTAQGRHFYGHGAYSADGSLLYATESVLDDDHRGILAVRDAQSFAALGTMPTYGASPHDCLLIDGGATMVVANGGGDLRGGAKPCVCYVDVQSEKLLERIELGAGRFNTGHLALSAAGGLAVVSAPRDGLPSASAKLGAVSLKPKGRPITTMRKPKAVVANMKGETLSVAIYEPQAVVMATHPEGDMMTLWDMASGHLLKRYRDFSGPRGVCLTLDQRCYVVSHLVQGRACITLVSTETREPLPETLIDPSFTSGSHVFVHDLAAA